eukprot:gene14340-15836_t
MEEYYKKSVTLVKRKLGGFGVILDSESGRVVQVVKGGEAESAGIQIGDIITSVNDEGAFTGNADFPAVSPLAFHGSTVEALAKVPVGKACTVSFEKKMDQHKISPQSLSNNGMASKDWNANVSNGKERKDVGLAKTSNTMESNGNVHNGTSAKIISKGVNDAKQQTKLVKVHNWTTDKETIDKLQQTSRETKCTKNTCMGSMMLPEVRPYGKMRPKDEVKRDAVEFLKNYYKSVKKEDSQEEEERIAAALKEIEQSGTYELDVKELIYGAKTAWRNAARCIGRIQWNKLQLFDARDVTTARGMFDAICKHIKFGTNKGNLR